MPRVKFSCIVSYSGEDRNHPVTNLLEDEVSKKKWLCKKGDPFCSVVLQLNHSVHISSVSIGAHAAAMVEVLVGRSENNHSYEVLVPSCVLLSMHESRRDECLDRVRTFVREHFAADVRDQKWDRVRLMCKQPFNRHLAYGLSFVHVSEDSDRLPSLPPVSSPMSIPTLDDSSDEEQYKPGDLFATYMQRKSYDGGGGEGTSSSSAESQIRHASSQALKNIRESSTQLFKTPRANKNEKDKDKATTSHDDCGNKRDRNNLMYENFDEKLDAKIDRIVRCFKEKIGKEELKKQKREKYKEESKKRERNKSKDDSNERERRQSNEDSEKRNRDKYIDVHNKREKEKFKDESENRAREKYQNCLEKREKDGLKEEPDKRQMEKREKERSREESDKSHRERREKERSGGESDKRERDKNKNDLEKREKERAKEESDKRQREKHEKERSKEESDKRERDKYKNGVEKSEKERSKEDSDKREREKSMKQSEKHEREIPKEESIKRKREYTKEDSKMRGRKKSKDESEESDSDTSTEGSKKQKRDRSQDNSNSGQRKKSRENSVKSDRETSKEKSMKRKREKSEDDSKAVEIKKSKEKSETSKGEKSEKRKRDDSNDDSGTVVGKKYKRESREYEREQFHQELEKRDRHHSRKESPRKRRSDSSNDRAGDGDSSASKKYKGLERDRSDKVDDRMKKESHSDIKKKDRRSVKRESGSSLKAGPVSSTPHTLMSGVVFTISGYENPRRADVRSKALAMGARYERHWTSDCTHLICAFPNTPKLKEVRALPNGSSYAIVKASWVEDCCSLRRLLPWQWCATEPSLRITRPDDWETVADGGDNAGGNSDVESEMDTDDEIQQVIKRQNQNTPSTSRQSGNDSPNNNSTKKNSPKKRSASTHAEKDVKDKRAKVTSDSDGEKTDQDNSCRENVELIEGRVLPNFFDDSVFIVDSSIANSSDVNRIHRYISAYGGLISKDRDVDSRKEVDYVISSRRGVPAANTGAKPVQVTPDWVLYCHYKCRKCSTQEY